MRFFEAGWFAALRVMIMFCVRTLLGGRILMPLKRGVATNVPFSPRHHYHSRQLAGTKAAMVSGDPLLKSSESVMRLVAAAVMSMTKVQRYENRRPYRLVVGFD